jgi:transketolase
MTQVSPSIEEMRAIARCGRREIVKAVAHAKGGHVGGPLSAFDILTALYFRVLNVRPDEPTWGDRDRFILSKGHASIALYTILALRGYFPLEELSTFDAIESRLQGHPDMTITPGVDMSSGSLGLGFSAGIGMALAARLAGKAFTTCVMLGDGECNEGIVWEGAHVAQRHALGNLVAIVDHNQLQQFGWRGKDGADRLPPYTGSQLKDRWTSFGWEALEVDGHDMAAVVDVLERAWHINDKPTVVIAHTVKGKGVSFMEGNYLWHSRVPTDEELSAALEELKEPSTEGQGGVRGSF